MISLTPVGVKQIYSVWNIFYFSFFLCIKFFDLFFNSFHGFVNILQLTSNIGRLTILHSKILAVLCQLEILNPSTILIFSMNKSVRSCLNINQPMITNLDWLVPTSGNISVFLLNYFLDHFGEDQHHLLLPDWS